MASTGAHNNREGNPLGRWRRRAVRLSLALALLAPAACANPCKDLANRLCNTPGCTEAQCGRWHERTARVPSETCEAGLRLLDRERLR